jgi:hypothetical protein
MPEESATCTNRVHVSTNYTGLHMESQAPYVLSLGPCSAFEASTDPVDTSAQAALAPHGPHVHQSTEQEESGDTPFMAM